MKKLLLPAWVLLALLLSSTVFGLEPGRAEHGELKQVKGVYVLKVWGTPRQRGVAQGLLAGKDLIAMLRSAFSIGIMTKEGYEKKVRPLVTKLFRWPSHVREELEGLLEGLNRSLNEKERHLPVLGRAVVLDDLFAINTLGDWKPFACSTISAWGTATPHGHTVVGRNFDYMLPPAMVSRQIILAHTRCNERLAFHTVTFPGIIGGITCLNEKGVFTAIHDVAVRPRTFPSNLTPRLVTLRLIAETALPGRALEQAVLICRENPTLYGNNFHVAMPANRTAGPRAGVIEYDSARDKDSGATLRSPSSEQHLTNTNHYRKRRAPSSCRRYAALEDTYRLLKAQAVKIDLSAMKVLIASAQVSMTLHQVVADLDTRTVAFAFQGRPLVSASKNGFHTLDWEDVFGE